MCWKDFPIYKNWVLMSEKNRNVFLQFSEVVKMQDIDRNAQKSMYVWKTLVTRNVFNFVQFFAISSQE